MGSPGEHPATGLGMVLSPREQAGEPTAGLLQKLYRIAVFGFRVPSQDVEDLLQDACVQFLLERRRRPVVTDGLLVVIVRRRCQDYWRSRSAHGEAIPLEEADLDGDGGRMARQLYAGARVAQAWPCISPTCRHVLAYRFWQEVPTQELADILGYRPGSLKRFISRCLARLRVHLQREP